VRLFSRSIVYIIATQQSQTIRFESSDIDVDTPADTTALIGKNDGNNEACIVALESLTLARDSLDHRLRRLVFQSNFKCTFNPVQKRWGIYDFSSIRNPNLNLVRTISIYTSSIKQYITPSLYFDLCMASIIRYLGGNYTNNHQKSTRTFTYLNDTNCDDGNVNDMHNFYCYRIPKRNESTFYT